MSLMSVVVRARSRSYMRWRFSQYSGVVPRARPMRRAVSAVIERRRLMMALMRIGGTLIVLASRYWLIPSSSMNSARCSSGVDRFRNVHCVASFSDSRRLRSPSRLRIPLLAALASPLA